MTARRVLFIAVLIMAASLTAWAQPAPFTIAPATLPIGGGLFFVGQMIPPQQFSTSPSLDEEFTWSVSSGTLPPGLIVDSVKGAVEGTPTQAGAFTFTIFSQEVSTNFTASRQYTLYVSSGPLTLTPVTHQQGAAGISYSSQTFQAGGGVPGYTWSLQNGTNADGLTIDSGSGRLTGAPQAGGVFAIGVTATDASGAHVSATFNLNVLGINTTVLSNGTVGTAYSSALAADGATGTLTWIVTSSTQPPPGLTLSRQGLISGIPTTSGVYPFAVQVTDSVTNLSTSSSFSITILDNLTITTTSLPNGTVGNSYSQTLTAAGSTNPLTWVVSSTSNGTPPGLNLDAQGHITGIPTQAGTFPFTVVVTDAIRQLTATQALSITVTGTATITPATLSDGFINVVYPPTTLTVAGATISNWAVTTGTLPAGLQLNASTGVISGTPTAAGSSSFSISATPQARATVLPPVVQSFAIRVNAVTVTTSGSTQQPSVGAALSGGTYPLNITGVMTLTFAPASGGSQNYDAKFATGPATSATFTIPAGASQGLFGSATSIPVISGTVAGTVTIATTLQDSAGAALTPPAPVVITVSPAVPVITKGAFTSANGGFSISVTGYSPTRDMTSALFHFTPTSAGITTADITVALTNAFTAWYSSSASIAFGSQFTMTVPFTFTGPPGTTVPCLTLTVALTNSKGSSVPFGLNCQVVTPVP